MTPTEYSTQNTCTISQNFGDNANPLYKGEGLEGHSGRDICCGYGTPIQPFVPIYVYKILDAKHPSWDGTGFTGVFGIDREGNEWLYGHCDPTAEIGKWYSETDIIGTEANHGEIYSGSTRITLAMQAAGDHRGSHRHVQYRPCDLVMNTTTTMLSTFNSGPYRDAQGYYYQYRYPNNGYAGCTDWTLEFGSLAEKVAGATKVAAGDPSEPQIKWLAQLLKKIGL